MASDPQRMKRAAEVPVQRWQLVASLAGWTAAAITATPEAWFTVS
jgi:hypothetical protein